MDTLPPTNQQQGAAVIPESRREAVNAGLSTIKKSMPNVYAAIQAKAEEIGNDAFTLVRRGLAGQPGCFYALEGGYVLGTPFGRQDPRMEQAAQFLVVFGSAHVCMWPMTADEARTYGAA